MKFNKQVWRKLFLIQLLISAINVQAQQKVTVKGVITDELGQPAAKATVSIKPAGTIVIADAQGAYLLQLIPGAYILGCSMIGYETQDKQITVGASAIITQNFILKKTITRDLNEVTVETMSKKKSLETQGFAVAIIETKEASLRNLSTNELLDRSVGVRVRQSGGIGSQVEYNLNGMSGSTIGIFIDGIEASTYGSSFNLNNIPPSMIERIEVYKGVLPSHLTGDYVGGAINVVLKKDVARNNVTVAASYGSFNTFQADIGTIYRHKKNGFTVRASGFYTYTDNSYTTWGRSTTFTDHQGIVTRPYRAKRFNNTYRSAGGRFEAGFTDVKWADQFYIGYNISDTYNEIPHGTTMARPYVGRFTEFNAHVVSLTYNKKDLFIKGLSFNANAVQSNRSTYLQDTVGYAYNWDGNVMEIIRFGERVPLTTSGGGQQGVKTITLTKRDITNMRSNLAYNIGSSHRIALNHKLEHTNRDDNDLLNPVNKDVVTVSTITKNIISLNYEAQTLQNKLRTNLLAKYTANRTRQVVPQIITGSDGINTIIKNTHTTFRDNMGYGATLSYNLLKKMFLIASTENSLIMPTDIQMFGDPETNILPNPGIVPEKNINYNLGFRLGSIESGRHKISLYSSAFWRNGFDKITREAVDSNNVRNESDADIQTTRYINLGKTQARGFEAEIIYIHDNKLNAAINFSKFNSLYKREFDAGGTADDRYNLQVPNEPFFTINTNVQYRLNNIFQKKSVLNVYYATGFVGEYYVVWRSPEWSKTPAQFFHDIGASYRFPGSKLVVSFDLKNILNAELYDNFGLQKPGRGIYFKLNYTISKFL